MNYLKNLQNKSVRNTKKVRFARKGNESEVPLLLYRNDNRAIDDAFYSFISESFDVFREVVVAVVIHNDAAIEPVETY